MGYSAGGQMSGFKLEKGKWCFIWLLSTFARHGVYLFCFIFIVKFYCLYLVVRYGMRGPRRRRMGGRVVYIFLFLF